MCLMERLPLPTPKQTPVYWFTATTMAFKTRGDVEVGRDVGGVANLQDKSEAEASEAPPGGPCRHFRELTLTIQHGCCAYMTLYRHHRLPARRHPPVISSYELTMLRAALCLSTQSNAQNSNIRGKHQRKRSMPV